MPHRAGLRKVVLRLPHIGRGHRAWSEAVALAMLPHADAGRAFEVTPEGRIVWEFYNSARGGEDDELIAILCEVARLRPEARLAWLDARHTEQRIRHAMSRPPQR